MSNHLLCCVTMYVWIYGIKSVSKHTDSIHSYFQGVSVGLDINAIGKSADDKNIRIRFLQILDEMADYVLSIDSTMTSDYDTYDL